MKYLLICGSSLVLALLMTPLAKFLSYKFKILDQPGHRKIHEGEIPLMGGAVIYLATTISLSVFYNNNDLIWIILTALAFVLFGLIDDLGYAIKARYKIIGHLLISFVFIFLSGNMLALFTVSWLNIILTACFITFMTNSFNMLDGMDGLVAGISMLAAVFFFLFSLYSGQYPLSVICLAVIGACLGFLRYNFNPASIFLGEGGSTLLGFIMALIAVKLRFFGLWDIALSLNISRLQWISFVIPLIVLGIPIFDTFFVFTHRFLNKRGFSTPGKDHSHHRLYKMGLSHKVTVLLLYGTQVILGTVAVILINAQLEQFAAVLVMLASFTVLAWLFLAKVKVYRDFQS